MQQRKLLNRDVIKYIAMVTMLVNHIGNIFIESGTWLHIILVSIGYFTAPTMIYFMIEGYHYTRSREKYLTRLFLFALISQIPYSFAFSVGKKIQINGLNMMFTLCICFLLIWNLDITYDPQKRGILLFIAIAVSCICDWPIIAPVFTFIFVRFGQNKETLGKAVFINTAIFGIMKYLDVTGVYSIPVQAGYVIAGMAGVALSGLCIMYLYNGKRIKRGKTFAKWFFYVFYPAHLLILGFIRVWG